MKIPESVKSLFRFRKESTSGHSRNQRILPRSSGGDFDEFAAAFPDGEQHISATAIRRILADAESGDPREQARYFSKLLVQSPVIAAHLQTRILSILSCDWSIVSADKHRAEETELMLRNAGMYELIRHLANALGFGYAGSAILWEEGGSAIRGFQKVHPANWVFDLGGYPAIVGLDGQTRPLSAFHENQFVFYAHNLCGETAGTGGLLRPLLWLDFFKHFAMRDRARYLERFGIPFITAKISNEEFNSDEVRNNVLSALGKMGSDGVGVISETSEIQLLNPATGSGADYQSWLDYLDHLIALVILGQTASSGDASGMSRGQIQENVRRDLLEADCQALMSCINRQILQPYELFRYGSTGTLRFILDYSSPENLLEKANLVKILADAGFHCDPAWIASVFNIQLSQTGKPAINSK